MRRGPLAVKALAAAVLILAGTGLYPYPPTPPGNAQERQEQPTKLTYDISVTVKNLEVIVRGKDSRPITGLKPENFKIFEDGVLRKITHFHEVAGIPSPAATEDRPAAPPEEKRALAVPESVQNRIVFFFDNIHCHPMNRNWIVKKLESFVVEHFRGGTTNQAMVVFLDQRLDVIQGFTADGSVLLQAVRSLRDRTSDALTRSRSWDSVQQEITMMAVRSGSTDDAKNFRAAASYAHGYIEEENNRLAYSLNSLQALAGRLGGLPGRKMVIYISDHMPLNPAEEVFRYISRLYPSLSAETEAFRYDVTDLFRRTVAACNAQDISVYSLQAEDFAASATSADKTNWSVAASGLRPITPGSARYNNGLETISRETGGSMITAKRDADARLATLEEDLSHYYSLGYASDAPADDSIHVIDVKLVDAGEDRVLRFRTGYLKSSAEETIKNRVAARLFLPQKENPLDVQLQGLPAGPPLFGKIKMRWKILIPIGQLTLHAEGKEYVGSVKIHVAMLDSERSWSEPEELRQDIRIPEEDLDKARASSFPYFLELHVKPGEYTVSMAVTDVPGRITSYLQFAQDVR